MELRVSLVPGWPPVSSGYALADGDLVLRADLAPDELTQSLTDGLSLQLASQGEAFAFAFKRGPCGIEPYLSWDLFGQYGT